MSTDERKSVIKVVAEDETKDVFNQIKSGAKDTAQVVGKAGQDAAKGIAQIGAGGEQAAQKLDGSARSIISSIQRTTAAIEAGEKGSAKYFEAIARQRGVGGDVLEPYLAQLRAAERVQAAATQGLGNMGISAAQTAAALRQVPAQFTDIIVSLQGGMNPMTVFLQQGGQLKDMFGGAGAAAKALGGYVVGLVNPFTVTAAAAAALALAYHQGTQESDAFVRSIVLTGNASGVTASQLREYAREIDGVVGTQAQAAAGLADFVAAGVRGGDELRRYTQTAIEWEKLTGQAVSKTAEQFASLQKEPLAAVVKLNEGTNFLTVSVYEQIQALDDQGRKADASKVAMEALDGAMRERGKTIRESLGYIERGWSAIKGAAAEAWDAMLNVGRAATLNDQINKATDELNRKLTEPLAVDNAAMRASREKGIEVLRREIAALYEKADAEKVAAMQQEESARVMNARIAFDKDYAKALEKEATLSEKLAKIRREGEEAQKSEAEIKRVLAYETEQHNKANKGSAAAARAAKKELADQAKVYADLAGLSSTYYADLARGQKELAKGLMTQAQYVKYVEDLIKKQPFAIALAKEEEKVRRELQKAIEDDIKQADRIADKRQAAIKSVEDALLKARQEEEAHALAAAANITLAEAMERLTIARLEDHLVQARAGAESQATIDALERELRARKELQGVLQQKGVREANKKAADEAAKDWDRTAQTISRTLSDYIMSGGKNAAQYLKRLFATLVLEPSVQGLVGGVFGTGAAQAAGSASSGLIQNGLNIASIGKNISSAITGGFEALSTTVGGWISSAGSYLGSTGMTGFGMGMQGMTIDAALKGTYGSSAAAGAGFAPYMQGAAGVLGGVYGGRLISGGYSAVGSSGNTAVNVGTAIGSIWGPVGSLVGGLIGGAVNRVFGRKLADQGIEGTFGGEDAFTGNSYKYFKGGLFRSDKTERSALDEELRKGLADQYSVMRLSTSAMAEVLGLGTAAIDGFTSSIKVSFNGLSAEESEKRLTEEFDKIAESLAGVALGTTDYTKAGETAVQSITRLSGSLTAVNGVFDQLSTTLYASSLAGADMASSLLDLFGGADGFGTATGTYFQNFYSGEEQRAALERQLNAALAKVNLQLPDIDQDSAREQYRALADAQDLTTESGRKAWATLMQLSGSFAQLTKSAEDVAAAAVAAAEEAAAAAEEAAKVMTGLLSDRRQLEAELMQAQGNATGYAAAMRAIATEGFTPAELAAYDYNEALRDQIDVMNEAAAAAERAASERMSLETRLLTLQGDTAALRQRELVALDASNRALQLHIWAIEDAQEAYTAATTAAQGAYSGLERSVSAQKSVLQEQYNAQKAALQEQSNAAKAAWQAQVSAAQKAASEMGSIASMLGNAFSNVKIDSPALSRARLQAAQSLIVGARDRNDVRATGLEDALGVAGGDTAKLYGKWEEWAFQQGVTAAAVGDLYGEAQKQLSAQEQLIAQLQASDGVAQAISDAEIAAMDALYQQELGLLDATLETGKSQLNALLGIDDSVLSVADAVAKLGLSMNAAEAARQSVAAAMASAAASGGGGGGGGVATAAPSYSDEQLRAMGLDPADINARFEWLKGNGATNAVSAGELVQSMLLSGQHVLQGVLDTQTNTDKFGNVYENYADFLGKFTDAQIIQASQIAALPSGVDREEYLRKILEQSINGSHADGLPYVPFDNYIAQLHKGERVLTAEENRLYTPNFSATGAGSGVIQSLVAEIAKLHARLAEISANTNATAGWTAATDRKLNRVVRNNAIATTPETA